MHKGLLLTDASQPQRLTFVNKTVVLLTLEKWAFKGNFLAQKYQPTHP